MTRQRIPVTARALIQRINRVLAKKDLKLLKARQNIAPELEGYYMININDELVRDNVNIEECGREEGVLKPYEHIIDVAPNKDSLLAKIEKEILKREQMLKKVERLKKEYEKQGLEIPESIAML